MKRRTVSIPDGLDARISREVGRRYPSVSEFARRAFERELSVSYEGELPNWLASADGPGDTVAQLDDLMAEGFGDWKKH